MEKLEKISALTTRGKRKSAPGFALTVFMQQGKTQIASDPIYITLHNFMITVRQRSSRPQLFRLFAARKDKMGNTPGKQLPTLLSKITRRGRWLVSASVRQYSKLAHSHTKASHRILPETKRWPTPPCSDLFTIIDFKTGNSHPWLKSIHVT